VFPPGLSFCGYEPCPERIVGAEAAQLAAYPVEGFDIHYPAGTTPDDIAGKGRHAALPSSIDDLSSDMSIMSRSPLASANQKNRHAGWRRRGTTTNTSNSSRSRSSSSNDPLPGGFHAGVSLSRRPNLIYDVVVRRDIGGGVVGGLGMRR